MLQIKTDDSGPHCRPPTLPLTRLGLFGLYDRGIRAACRLFERNIPPGPRVAGLLANGHP